MLEPAVRVEPELRERRPQRRQVGHARELAASDLILNAPGGEPFVAGALSWSIGSLVVSIPTAAYFFRRLTR